jgi:16S rRNA (cytosine1402-N4)-methyltransferase
MSHKSVLLQETIELMNLRPGMTVIDATIGAGGHSKAILKHIGSTGRLMGLDKDQTALKIANENLGGCSNLKLVHADFKDIGEVAHENGFTEVDAILMDIGVSSMQLDQRDRGFSFNGHEKLDMRMDRTQDLTAAEIVNTYAESDLVRIFRQYGEEPQARKVAAAIVQKRSIYPIDYTDQLAEVVRGVIHAPYWARGKSNGKTKIDPATKVFQAIRIETNGELKALESALPQAVGIIKKGGRIAVISFHSLEDKMVKRFFEEKSKTCVCPPEYPKCICDITPELKKVTKKAITADADEVSQNPRSRSARLRVAERI